MRRFTYAILPAVRQALLVPAMISGTCSIAWAQIDVVIVETRAGGQNLSAYTEVNGNWAISSAKSSAAGLTGGIGSRFATTDGSTFRVSPTLAHPGSNYIVEVTHGTSSYIPVDLMVSVAVSGATGLTNSTDAFKQKPDNAWRVVGTMKLNDGVSNPVVAFAKQAGSSGTGQRFYADAVRFTYADEPCLGTPQIVTVNGPLVAGQTFVDVPTVVSNATAVLVYADGAEIGRLTNGISGGVERVTTRALVKGEVITATQIGTNHIESCRPTTGARVGGGPIPRLRISLSIRQNTNCPGPIGASWGATNSPIVFLGATNVYGGGFALAPMGGKVFQPDVCWQTVTFQRGDDPAHPMDPTYAWFGSTGTNALFGNFGVLDAIALAIDDLTDTGPFRVYIDEFRNGDVLIQGFESATNGQQAVMFYRADFSTTTSPFLLAQPPGTISPNVSEVTDAFTDRGLHSLLVSWQFKDLAGGNWVRLCDQGSGTPSVQLDLRLPISFRMLLLPAGLTNTPLHICIQPQDATGLQTQPATLNVLAVGTPPLAYQWYFQGQPIPDATNQTLLLPSAQLSNSGLYHVVVSDASGSVTSSNATLLIEPAAFTDIMEPLWTLAPGDRPYLAADGQQSGLAYNWTGNLLLVSRTGGDAVIILNGDTGAEVGRLQLNSLAGGYYRVNKVCATSDTFIYVANLTTNAMNDPFKIYAWWGETPNAPPDGEIWSGNPGVMDGARWGDTLDVRELVGPEFVLAAYNDNRIAVLRLASTDLLFTVGGVPAGAFNDGLAWGQGDTVWAKSYGGPLYHIALDMNASTATVLHVYTNLPSLAPMDCEPDRRVLGAVSLGTPDALRLFNLANLVSGPVASDTEFFPTNNAPNAVGAVSFGPDRVYGLDPNRGILAMSLRPFLKYSRQNRLLQLEWTGTATLQSATNIVGPFNQVPGVTTSPATIDMSTNRRSFFRLQR